MSLLSSQWLPASLSMEAKVTKMALVGPLCSNTQGCDLLPHLLPLLIPSQSHGLFTVTLAVLSSPDHGMANFFTSFIFAQQSPSQWGLLWLLYFTWKLISCLSFPTRTWVQRQRLLLVLFMNAFLVPRRSIWCAVSSTCLSIQNNHFFLYKSLWCILIILIRLSLFLTF